MEKSNFQNLIDQAVNGQASAQRQLFADHYSYVMAITLRYMGSREEAEEVLNDTFLKVFDQLGSFKRELAFRPWVRRIAVNTCIDRLRKLKKSPIRFGLNGAEEYVRSDTSFEIDPDIDIVALLQKLPPRYRAVFNLYVFEGYKHREISKILKISEGTSKSNYARAKDFMRKKLANVTKVNRKGKIHWAFKTILL